MEAVLGDAHGIASQLRHVVALQEKDVPFGILLRQDKSLVRMALLVEVGDEGTRVVAVHSATAEDEPTAVAAPGMEAVHVGRVGFGQGIAAVCLEVLHPKVARLVPDVELSVVALCVEDVTSVGRDARHGDALVLADGIDHHLRPSEAACLGVEGDGHQVVAYAVELYQELLRVEAVGQRGVEQVAAIGCAIVQRASIRRPAGKSLQVGRSTDDVAHLVLRDIVEEKVARRVHHLNLLRVIEVEGLPRLVGREGHKVLRRMPGRIDAAGDDGAVLELYLVRFAVLHDDGAAVVGAYMEQHAFRAAHAIVVTVDAMVLLVVVFAVVLIDGHLVEVREVALVDAQLAVKLIAGFDESVAEERIDRLLCYAEGERLEADPAFGVLGIDIDRDCAALACRQERTPLGRVQLHNAVFSSGRQKLLSAALQMGNVCCTGRIGHHEVERGNVRRHHDILIVGIDSDLRVCLSELLRHLGLRPATYYD